MPRTYLSQEEAEKIRALIADNQLHRALTSLQLTSSYQPNEALRSFVGSRFRDFDELMDGRSKGTSEEEKLRAKSVLLRKAILDKVDELVAAVPSQPSSAGRPILKCDHLSKRYRLVPRVEGPALFGGL